MKYLYIFLGGAIGALLRYIVSFLNFSMMFPLGTFIANILGSFILGIVGVYTFRLLVNKPNIQQGLSVGFLGTLTTFSTFQFELVQLLQQGLIIWLIVYACVSYVVSLLACYAGMKLGGRLA